MPAPCRIRLTDRYKLIFAEHHYASDYRLRLFRGWALTMAALATALIFVAKESDTIGAQLTLALECIIPILSLAFTALARAADLRHRSALNATKEAGSKIEEGAGVPDDQRFFAKLLPASAGTSPAKGTHSWAIDLFFGGVGVLQLGLLALILADHFCK